MAETTAQARRLEIWNRLTPEQRDYDRFVAGVIPQGASRAAETAWGREEGYARLSAMTGESACSCHINPPCSYCESLQECETCGEFVPADDMEYHADAKYAAA